MSFDKDYKLSYLKVIWQNKYVGIPVPTVGPSTTFSSALQGDDLATKLAEAYIEVGNGGTIQLEGTDAERLALTPKLLNLYKSKSIIFNNIGIFRHMLVTLFLLSENHISPMASEPTDEDLDEEFLKKFQETQLDGINQLGNIISSSMRRQEQLNATMLKHNNEIRQDLVDAMKQMMLVIEERHNEPPKYVPDPKVEELPCHVAVKKEEIRKGDRVRLDNDKEGIVRQKSGKILIVNVGGKDEYVLPSTATKIAKLSPPELKRNGKRDDSEDEEYSEDFEDSSSIDDELLKFSAAGTKPKNV